MLQSCNCISVGTIPAFYGNGTKFVSGSGGSKKSWIGHGGHSLLSSMQASVKVYLHLLQRCVRKNSLLEGKRVHAQIIKDGFQSNILVANTLVSMYGNCKSLLDARKVFDTMPQHNVFSWAAIISAYAKQGQGKEALHLFQQMQQAGVMPDKAVYAVVLKACACANDLEQGKRIHAHLVADGFGSDVLVASALIDMYGKCGSVADARQVFNKMPERDVVSWTVMIAGYAQQGYGQEALSLFEQMKLEGIMPDKLSFVSILKSCAELSALERGKHVHTLVIRSGFEVDVFVANTLVIMYAKCGSIEEARQVFNNIPEKDVVSWNAMISGYIQRGCSEEAVALFEQMQQEGMRPNNITFVSSLKACASLTDLEMGKHVHAQIIRSGLELDVVMGSALVDMYAKCRSIKDARYMFNTMRERNVVSWNAMITGYVQQGCGQEALMLFDQMQREGTNPNNITFVSILKACASLTALDHGKQVHTQVVKCGLESDLFIGNTLVDMYAKCGSIEHASQVFYSMPKRDVVSWTVMIAGYAQQDCAEVALTLFQQMQLEGMKPTDATFISILKACGSLADLDCCKQIHSHIIRSGLESHVFLGSTLVDTYMKCSGVKEAHQVFKNLQKRDVVSWTAMIAGYAEQGIVDEAFTLFEEMQREGVKPNNITYVSILKACANLGALEWGKQIHACIIKNGLESDLIVRNTLIDMYAKCGSIWDAHRVFDQMHERDSVSFTALIAGYALQGLGVEAVLLFEQMQKGMKPDPITFTSVLTACSRAGLVDEGCHQFDLMAQVYGIAPTTEHYACMVDLLGRAGHLDEAEDFIKKMPILPDIVVWMSLLGACRGHGNVKLGECAFDYIHKLEPGHAGTYVLLSNIYAAAGRWNTVEKLRNEMEDGGTCIDFNSFFCNA